MCHLGMLITGYRYSFVQLVYLTGSSDSFASFCDTAPLILAIYRDYALNCVTFCPKTVTAPETLTLRQIGIYVAPVSQNR